MEVIIFILNFIALIIIFLLLKAPLNALVKFLRFYREIYSQDKSGWGKRKLKWYLFVYLPHEILPSIVVFLYIFLLFNWHASWLILIAISGVFFKKIIQDPLYILHAYVLNLIFKPKNNIHSLALSKIFPHAIYMPHLGYSKKEVKEALSTLFLSYLNNQNKETYLIYHSDNREPSLILEALKTAKLLRQTFKLENFYFFQRNTELPERNFLGKPGAYLADYQFLFSGILHPVIYLEKEWDARLQIKFKLDHNNKIITEKFHFPFITPEKLESGYEYFIYYLWGKEEFYLKEKPILVTAKGENYIAEIIPKIYLISKSNPKIKFLLYMGGIYSLKGELLLRPKEWEMQINGKVTLKNPEEVIPSVCYQIFPEKQIYLNGKRYLVDSELNIRDEDFNVFLPKGSFDLKYSYELYRREGNFLYLIQKEFSPDFTKIIGQDFRRNPLQPLHKIPSEVLEEIKRDDFFDPFEKKQLQDLGIWGNISKINSFKFGWEEEFLIPDVLVTERIILKGGYYLIDKTKIKQDKFYSPEREIKIQYKKDKPFLLEENSEFPLIGQEGQRIENVEDKVLIKAPFINYLRKADSGYIANEKDNFWFYQNKLLFKDKDTLYQVCSDPIKLEKKFIYIEPSTGDLKNMKLIAPPGSYEIKEKTIRFRKKLLPQLVLGFFENDILNLFFQHENKILKLKDKFYINEYGIWAEEIETEMKLDDSLKIRNEYIIQEQTLAPKGKYKIHQGEVEINGKNYPLGIGIYQENQPLKFKEENLYSGISLMIINQIDSDGEFLKESIPEINSILAHQFLLDEFEYGMIQPEISFANSSDSLFARLLSWAHEEFKFAERAFFNVYQEGNSYGKVSKILPLYVNNILFKESIPAIARTHDHWEAMQLRTLFKFSGKSKSSKLVENVPSNLYSFLKRKQGWLAGDLLLLEFESKIGIFLNLFRALSSLIKKKVNIARFWIKYLKRQSKYLEKRQKFYSALGLQRILTLERTTLSTTYLMLWLLISGWLVLLVPGSLTAKNLLLPWIFFLTSIFLIIILPKFFIPLSSILIKKIKTFDALWLICSTLGSIYLVNKYLPRYPLIVTCAGIIGYTYILTRAILLPLSFIIFGKRRRLRVRIASGIFSLSLIIILLNGYEILYIFSTSTTFYWIPFLLLEQLPHLLAYLIPIWTLGCISKLGRRLILTFKEGIKELSATTSTLLMLLVYEPIHIFKLIIIFTAKPFSRIEWFPQSYFDRIAIKINSLFKAYYHFYLPPLFSLLFIIIPVNLSLLPPGILSLGWPIFIWSWLLGPFWAYWTQRHRRDFERLTPSILILRKIMDKNLNYDSSEITQVDQLLEQFHFNLEDEDEIKLKLYFLTQKAKGHLSYDGIKSRVDEIINFYLNSSSNIRVTDWQTLPDFSRVKVIKKFSRNLDKKLLNEIEFYNQLLFHILKKGWAEVEWDYLREKEKQKIIQTLASKYSSNFTK